jgi:hypothetical protein
MGTNLGSLRTPPMKTGLFVEKRPGHGGSVPLILQNGDSVLPDLAPCLERFARPPHLRVPRLAAALRPVAGLHRADSLHLLWIRDVHGKYEIGKTFCHLRTIYPEKMKIVNMAMSHLLYR